MKLYSICVASLFYLDALAAKSSSPDRFQAYHSLSSTPIDLDDTTYGNVTSAPRDYSVAVLLTATEARFGCTVCRGFAPEWELIAKSWNKGDKKGEARILFGTLEFSNGRNTFQSVCYL